MGGRGGGWVGGRGEEEEEKWSGWVGGRMDFAVAVVRGEGGRELEVKDLGEWVGGWVGGRGGEHRWVGGRGGGGGGGGGGGEHVP